MGVGRAECGGMCLAAVGKMNRQSAVETLSRLSLGALTRSCMLFAVQTKPEKQ